MSARVGVVVFPGTNCELDVVWAVESLGGEAELLWHGDRTVRGVDAVVVPGGFAHGDYLRTGAIARFSPVMEAVAEHAADGGAVVGICNGFQVLTEAGLLPGALQKNTGLTFVCDAVALEVVSTRSVLTNQAEAGAVLRIPINHFEGNYVCDDATLARLRADDRIVLRYVTNPNGSLDDIAGISNEAGNVVGLMPHPERASDPLLGSADGTTLLSSLLHAAESQTRARGVANELGVTSERPRSPPAATAPSERSERDREGARTEAGDGREADGLGGPRDPGLLQNISRNPELTPRGVRDALPLRILGRRLHERPFERRQVDLGAHRLELLLEVHTFLDQLELLQRRPLRVGDVDGGEALLDRIGRASTTPPGSVLLQRLEVVLHRAALVPAFGECGLVLVRHRPSGGFRHGCSRRMVMPSACCFRSITRSGIST